MAIFPRTVLSWNVATIDDINENSLRLFCALEPKIELLVIGIGDEPVTPELSKRLQQIMKTYKINVEVLKTEAVSFSYGKCFESSLSKINTIFSLLV